MELVQQEPNSTICGQCCVAMVGNISLEKSIELFGHSHSTRTKEVGKVLNLLGNHNSGRLERVKGELPHLCIVKIHWNDQKMTHWSVHYDGYLYDPAYGVYPPEGIGLLNGRITSYLKFS